MHRIQSFFLKPGSARPLAVLRIGLSLVLLVQAFLLRKVILDFFASDGLVQGDLAQYLSVPGVPRVSGILETLTSLGIHVSEVSCLFSICAVYVLSLALMGVGLWTRGASITAWFLHWVLMNTGYTTAYGVDAYAHVFLFYLMWMPVGDAYSMDVLLRRRADVASTAARLSARVLQIHLCIAYFFSGVEKAAGPQWWNGELLWRAFSLPVYRQFDMSWLIHWPFLLKLGGWTTLFLELGYCIFIWPKATRKVWIAGMVSLHLGIIIFLGLGLFGTIMCLLTLAVFGVSGEPEMCVSAMKRRPLFSWRTARAS